MGIVIYMGNRGVVQVNRNSDTRISQEGLNLGRGADCGIEALVTG
jgi:hypothetical protein